MTPVRLEPAAPRSRVKHSTTEPLRSPTPCVDMYSGRIIVRNMTGRFQIVYLCDLKLFEAVHEISNNVAF